MSRRPNKNNRNDDVEIGEETPLLFAGGGSNGTNNKGGASSSSLLRSASAFALREMKAESLKERAVAATAAVSCT